jgi:predicted Mrr-cat superfamily restriction endonuclease
MPVMVSDEQNAWVVRMHTGGGDVVASGLEAGMLLLGWSDTEGLINRDDYWDFREAVHETYYSDDETYRRSGSAAGQLWAFIHDMTEGDLVVVPHGRSFYVARVAGPALHDPDAGPRDTAHRRPVEWLNDAVSIPRSHARSALISRMKSYRTVTAAGDLVADIREVLQAAGAGSAPPTLASSLRQALVETTKQQLLTGHMDERRFEELVRDLVLALGAVDAHIVSRRHDIGADIEAEFSIGHFATVPVRIQVKYWRGNAGPYPIDQLLSALRHESMADVALGIVVTTAAFTEEVRQHAAEQSATTGKQIVLIDGDDLCRMIVDYGLNSLLAAAT